MRIEFLLLKLFIEQLYLVEHLGVCHTVRLAISNHIFRVSEHLIIRFGSPGSHHRILMEIT